MNQIGVLLLISPTTLTILFVKWYFGITTVIKVFLHFLWTLNKHQSANSRINRRVRPSLGRQYSAPGQLAPAKQTSLRCIWPISWFDLSGHVVHIKFTRWTQQNYHYLGLALSRFLFVFKCGKGGFFFSFSAAAIWHKSHQLMFSRIIRCAAAIQCPVSICLGRQCFALIKSCSNYFGLYYFLSPQQCFEQKT